MKDKTVWPTLIALSVGSISVVLGVLNWQLAGVQNFGLYLALFALSFALVLVPSVFFYFQRTTELQHELTAMIQGADIESVPDKKKLVRALIGQCSRIECYGASELLHSVLKEANTKIPSHIETHLFCSGKLPKTTGSTMGTCKIAIVPMPFPIQALFFVNSAQVASGVILFPEQNGPIDRGWIHFSYFKIVNRLRTAYHEAVAASAVRLEGSLSMKFSEDSVKDFLDEFADDWKRFPLTHSRLCRFGNEVSAVQQQLTDSANNVDALDMSALEIWLESGRLYPVVVKDAELVRRGGTVRRIFIAPSEADMHNDPQAKETLKRVLKLQSENGIKVGVVYRDKLPVADITDFAIYYSSEGTTAWVETQRQPGDASGSEGIFTSSAELIKPRQEEFNRLWSRMTPELTANKIMA